MPTLLFFNSARGDNPLTLTVNEDPGEIVSEADTGDRIVTLTNASGKPVWVNLANVAYWQEQTSSTPQAAWR